MRFPFVLFVFFLLRTETFKLDLIESPVEEEIISYFGVSELSHELEGLMVRPRIRTVMNKLPAIILFHHFMGRDNFTDDRAKEIAKMGYVVFAADTYGKTIRSDNIETNFETMADVITKRSTILRDRVLAAWNYVNSLSFVDKNRIGTVGYCYGGLNSLDLARYDVGLKVAVSFHGTLVDSPGDQIKTTRSIIQVHHGDADTYTNETDVSNFLDEMRGRKAKWHLIRYADAEHAFTVKGIDNYHIPGASYNAEAASRSWEYMKIFLKNEL